MDDHRKPCVLTIGGLDPSGGAGLPADARAVAAFGAHACGIATAVIAQNTQGVARFEAVSPEMLAAQLDNLLEDITPAAIKIGMLPNSKSIAIVANRLRQLHNVPIIVDPVFAPSSGPEFSGATTIDALLTELAPMAELITPNLLEAQRILGISITVVDEMREAAGAIGARFGLRFVLLKGGHLPSDKNQTDGGEVVDMLFDAEGCTFVELSLPRVAGFEVRGTGCMLASAIAAQRAQGVEMEEAAWAAKRWLAQQIARAVVIGKGRRVAGD